MKGVERHRFEECSVGDWVLCGSEYPNSAKVYIEGREFHRIWAEPSKVISAWIRVS